MNIYDNEKYYEEHWDNYCGQEIPIQKLKLAEEFFNPVLKYLDQKGIKILDVGCGDGVHFVYLERFLKQDFSFTGIDIAESVINFLKSKTTDKFIDFQVMNLENLELETDSFDLVYAFGVLGYCNNPEVCFQELVRVCKPNGLIGIYSPDISGLQKLLFFVLRKFTHALGQLGAKSIAKTLIPLYGFLSSSLKMCTKNSGQDQLEEVIMTNIGPPNLKIISHEMLYTWFQKNYVEILSENKITKSMLWGEKENFSNEMAKR